MDEATACVGDLITEATGFVEHLVEVQDPEALVLVHDELAAAVAGCPDAGVASDAGDLLAQLDRVVRGLQRRPDLPLAS